MMMEINTGISEIDIRLNPKKYCREVLRVICDGLDFHFGAIVVMEEEDISILFSSYNLPSTHPQLLQKMLVHLPSNPANNAMKTKEIAVVTNIASPPLTEEDCTLLKSLKVETIALA